MEFLLGNMGEINLFEKLDFLVTFLMIIPYFPYSSLLEFSVCSRVFPNRRMSI